MVYIISMVSLQMDSPLTLTPRRGLDFDDDEVKHLLTPEVRKDLRQLFEDEDSGLGMDYDKVRFFKLNVLMIFVAIIVLFRYEYLLHHMLESLTARPRK